MVYLVGVNHLCQYSNCLYSSKQIEAVKAFSDYIEGEVRRVNVAWIGEEFNEEAKTIHGCDKATMEKVAEKLNIKHSFCNPCSGLIIKNGFSPHPKTEKEKLENFTFRENYWKEEILQAIKENPSGNVLFVCGQNHIEKINNLLKNSIILSEGWCNQDWLFD